MHTVHWLSNGSAIVDIEFSRRLESTEGIASSRFIDARKSIHPDSDSSWSRQDNAYLLFDGVHSPLTQTFGLGTGDIPDEKQWNQLESFFLDRSCSVNHEVSPLVHDECLNALSIRGYRPMEWTNVMYRSLTDIGQFQTSIPSRIRARSIDSTECSAWANVAAEGWSIDPETVAFLQSFGHMAANAVGYVPMFAVLDEQPIATAGLFIHDGVCLLAGASTIVAFRNLGAQNTLLRARLEVAKESGCELAMMCARPGSSSQRNAQRNGFHIAYTRVKWTKDWQKA